MIKVLTSISYDDALFKYWASYYSKLGVDEIIVSVRPSWMHRKSLLEKICSVNNWPVKIVESCSEEVRLWEKGIDLSKNILRKHYTTPEDWIIPADLDEFIQFPGPLKKLVAQFQRTPFYHLQGSFIDRISFDGRLTKVISDSNLWNQYPLACKIWRGLGGKNDRKVTLCHANSELGRGHHSVMTKSLSQSTCSVHHFKWREGVIEEMQSRVALFERNKCRGVAKDIQNVLDYLKRQGRVVPEDFNTQFGWRPGDMVSRFG